jgi:hypothetical protein
VRAHQPAVLADLDRERVDPDEGVGAGVEGPLPERGDLRVEVAGHLRDPRARQRLDSELLGQPLHTAGRDAEQVCGGDHGDQGLFGAATVGQQPVREVGALAQLLHGELDGAGAGVPVPGAVAVAPVDPLLAALPVSGAAHLVGLGGHHHVRHRGDHLPE